LWGGQSKESLRFVPRLFKESLRFVPRLFVGDPSWGAQLVAYASRMEDSEHRRHERGREHDQVQGAQVLDAHCGRHRSISRFLDLAGRNAATNAPGKESSRG
jgi:hypothetical protein